MTQELGVLREELEPISDARPTRSARPARGALLLALFVASFGGLFLAGWLPKQAQRERLDARASSIVTNVPRVAVVRPAKVELPPVLSLPGSVQGLQEVTIYARTDGYLGTLACDMGDTVSAGQLLATVDNPEVDREIQHARATLASADAQLVRAKAAHAHAQVSLKRYEALAHGMASQEEIDQKRTQAALDEADVGVANAARAASAASLDRLLQVKAFSKVVAPFAGTITSRTVERGSLVSSGRDSPLFKITSLDTVRVFVQVPQSRVAGVTAGQKATVSVAEYPGAKLEGRISRVAGALDASSRTMNVEVRVPNPDRKLLPGMYATVALEIGRVSSALSLPATALVVGEKGVRVASVDADGRVRMIPVEIARDRGADVELASGLSGTESIIANPGPAVVEGSVVKGQ
jgi:membrane fusion protein, multidrug efflux system